MILKRERLKKSSTGFAAFVDVGSSLLSRLFTIQFDVGQRIKDSTADTRNRVGLSELLMDPIQRIPRYILLWERV